MLFCFLAALNGLYQGMFQLPTLTSSITTATTSSVTASSKSSSSVASLTRSPSPASPTKKRPSSTTSSHEAEREGSSRTRGTEPKSREPKERESPKITMDAAVAMDIAAGYPHLFPYPIGAGAGMFPPSIFGYPYAAGYPGTPMFPGLYQPYAAPSSPTVSSHSPSHKSSSSASGRSSTTTSVTMTTASSSVSHSSSPAPSSRKSLFDAMGHSDGTSRPEVLSIPKLTQHLDRASQKKSPKVIRDKITIWMANENFAKYLPPCSHLSVVAFPFVKHIRKTLLYHILVWNSHSAMEVFFLYWIIYNYHKISNIRHTKSWNLNISRLGLQWSLCNILKPSVKWRMKMYLEQRGQAML